MAGTITREAAVEFIKNGSKGRIFSVQFIKRGDGSLRLMAAKRRVTKWLKGVGPTYDFEEKGLICVGDMVKKQYRCIPVEGIVRIKVNNQWLTITG